MKGMGISHRRGAAVLALVAAAAGCGEDQTIIATCVPGARTCNGEIVLVCDPELLVFKASEECPVGTPCQSGRCVGGSFPDTIGADAWAPDTVAPVDTRTPDTVTPVDTWTSDTWTSDTWTPDTWTPDTWTPDTWTPDTWTPDTWTPDTTEPADTLEPVDTTEVAVDTLVPVDAIEPADTVTPPTDTVTPTDLSVAQDIVVVSDPFDPGPLNWDRIPNNAVVDDLVRVKWHPSGAYALILGRVGKVLRYDAQSRTAAVVGSLGATNTVLADLDVDPAGGYFLVVGQSSAGQRLWRLHLDDSDALVVDAEVALPYGTAAAVTVEPGRLPARFAVGTRTTSGAIVNRIHLYTEADGLSAAPKAWGTTVGLTDLMWGDPALYGGSANVIALCGVNGTDSRTWVLDSDLVVANGWGGGFGNAGRAAWRPGPGGYGISCGWSSNKLYVFDGTWHLGTLPVPTGAAPQAIAWRANGTRALVVGRVLSSSVYAVAIEIPAGTIAGWTEVYTNQSIPDFDGAPWFGNSSSMHLLDVDWRPGPCDEGLVVGSDSGTSWSPTFGIIGRYWDANDPACVP